MRGKPNVPAENFCQTLAANLDNDKLSDAEFREFVRNSLPIVIFRNSLPIVIFARPAPAEG